MKNNYIYFKVLPIFLLLHIPASNALDALTGTVETYHPSSATSPIRSTTLTGQLDTNAFSMTNDAWSLFGKTVVTNIELLTAGTYTRSGGDYPNSDTVTVGPNQLGAFILYSNGNNTWPGFQVWDVTPEVNSLNATYTIVDSDNDGIPGHQSWTGPYGLLSYTYNFTSVTIQPAIGVTIDATGGTTQQCAGSGGHAVTLTANVQTIAGAILDEIFWTIDGNPAGTGISISPFLNLGTHSVEATAVANLGLTDTALQAIEIQDTTGPSLDIQFIDANTGQVITSIPGSAQMTAVQVSLNAADNCDPAPTATGFAVPVFEVVNGTLFNVQASQNQVDMPVSGVSITATAVDTTGNKTIDTATLSINP